MNAIFGQCNRSIIIFIILFTKNSNKRIKKEKKERKKKIHRAIKDEFINSTGKRVAYNPAQRE